LTGETTAIAGESRAKLAIVHEAITAHDLSAIRLRGADWFAWLTCGASSVIDTSAEAGVAEGLITRSDVFVIADRIDADRLSAEELTTGWPVVAVPWALPEAREQAVLERLEREAVVASDRPRGDEMPLPVELRLARLRLMPTEVERYRALCFEASRAASVALRAARPTMTEAALGALVAQELLAGGMWPVVVLVGGARRLQMYRHPTPRGDEPIGERAMLVVCARRHGLIANLTRFVYFRPPLPREREAIGAVADVEAAALDASVQGATLGDVYTTIAGAYARAGFAGAEADHHQGGLTGYRTREEIATPASATLIGNGMALAWNPSLPGAKIEDTFVVTPSGLEALTVDPDWPTEMAGGRRRPQVLLAD
jgi:Xaa-Pro aminopeptidase